MGKHDWGHLRSGNVFDKKTAALTLQCRFFAHVKINVNKIFYFKKFLEKSSCHELQIFTL